MLYYVPTAIFRKNFFAALSVKQKTRMRIYVLLLDSIPATTCVLFYKRRYAYIVVLANLRFINCILSYLLKNEYYNCGHYAQICAILLLYSDRT